MLSWLDHLTNSNLHVHEPALQKQSFIISVQVFRPWTGAKAPHRTYEVLFIFANMKYAWSELPGCPFRYVTMPVMEQDCILRADDRSFCIVSSLQRRMWRNISGAYLTCFNTIRITPFGMQPCSTLGSPDCMSMASHEETLRTQLGQRREARCTLGSIKLSAHQKRLQKQVPELRKLAIGIVLLFCLHSSFVSRWDSSR